MAVAIIQGRELPFCHRATGPMFIPKEVVSRNRPNFTKCPDFSNFPAIFSKILSGLKTTRRHLDALAVGTATIHDDVKLLTANLADALEGVQAQLIGYVPPSTTAELVRASNKHTANFSAVSTAITHVDSRLEALENVAPSAAQIVCMTKMEAEMDALSNTVKTLMARVSSLSGSSPTHHAPAPTNDAHLLALFKDFINVNGKCVRDADDSDVARNIHSYPLQSRPLASVQVPPIVVTPVAATAPLLFAPAIAAHAAAAGPLAFPTAPLAPPAAFPHAPPGGPPRARADPGREVLLGPMTWGQNVKDDDRNLISAVLPTAARTPFRIRRAHDDFHTVCIFDSEAIADWIIAAWSTAPRVGYEHNTIEVPHGYRLLSRTRRPKACFGKSWGGVVAIVRQWLPVQYREDFSGPDFMVLQLHCLLLYNIYLLPEGSMWAGILDSDPCNGLTGSLSLAYMAGYDIALMGDANARTASEIADPLDLTRVSMDKGPVSQRASLSAIGYKDMITLHLHFVSRWILT
ncbi:hypothetical protein B0H10DRAFT_1966763 [Mycena sp. CBHHK59/15]|nr:hypothetical protein B0H10DRAFT_1966763 [Mycena sp. CBHHK59/15]